MHVALAAILLPAGAHAGRLPAELTRAGRDTVVSSPVSSLRLEPRDKTVGIWSDEFYRDGDLDGAATALWARPDGLLASGEFVHAGNTVLNHVGLWDGTAWRPLGAGLPRAVRAFAEFGGQVYAGAYRWDGAAWENVLQTNGTIYALTLYRGCLVVGGPFTQAHGVDVPGLFAWDGSTVTPLVDGPDGYVLALAARDTLLAVGGEFDAAGSDTTAHNVAIYDGYDWAGLGGGVGGTQHYCCDIWGAGMDFRPFVQALAWQDEDLIVGGRFTTAGPDSARTIARWDGEQWHALGNGITAPSCFSNGLGYDTECWPPEVQSLLVQGATLYVGGAFPSASGVPSDGVVRWDGSNWLTCAGGLASEGETAEALATFGGEVHVGGYFSIRPSHSQSQGVTKWTGSAWSPTTNPPGLGLTGRVGALLPYGDDLVVAGDCLTAGPDGIASIAAFDGHGYARIGGGDADGEVNALTLFGGDLVAAGGFDLISGTSARHVARWDGATWQPLGEGLDFTVTALAVHEGQLYAGGTLSYIFWPWPEQWKSGETLREELQAEPLADQGRLSRWNGSAWEPLLTTDRSVRTLASYGGELYVGGEFTTVSGQGMTGLVRYDPASGAVTPCAMQGNHVLCLVVWNGLLVVGGQFNWIIDELVVRHLAFFDGSTWTVPAPMTDIGPLYDVYGLHAVGDQLFIVGTFATRVAMYDGVSWRSFGAGVASHPFCVSTYRGQLYVGGHFNFAGGRRSNSLARWDQTGLPVSFASLIAERAGRAARLSWELRTEGLAPALHVWRETPGAARARLTAAPISAASAGVGEFTDPAPPPGEADYWLEELAAGCGASLWHGPAHLPAAPVPAAVRLDQNRPNPFNPRTTLTLALPQAGRATLAVYDARGRRVATLLDGELPAGEREVAWDGRDGAGRAAAAGVYYVRLDTESVTRTVKITLAR